MKKQYCQRQHQSPEEASEKRLSAMYPEEELQREKKKETTPLVSLGQSRRLADVCNPKINSDECCWGRGQKLWRDPD